MCDQVHPTLGIDCTRTDRHDLHSGVEEPELDGFVPQRVTWHTPPDTAHYERIAAKKAARQRELAAMVADDWRARTAGTLYRVGRTT